MNMKCCICINMLLDLFLYLLNNQLDSIDLRKV